MIDSNQILGGNSLKKIIAKPVGMFELFYDLVFVYAISRITAMIHHPVNGSIPLVTFLQFLLVVIVVMQIWLYQVIYFNRCSKNQFLDIGGLVLNMFVAVYLANNINTECRFSIRNLLTLLLIFALGVSYLWVVIKSKIGISICLLIWNLLFFLEFYIKGNKNEFR